MSDRPVFWGSAGAIPVSVQNGSTTGFSPEERKAYLAGWRDAREAAAKEIDCICTKECGSSEECRRDLADEIRALPEPSQEDRP